MSVGDALTPFQERMLAALQKAPNGQASTQTLATRLGSSRVAVASAGRSLERKGRVVTILSDGSMWAVRIWCLRR